MGGSNAMHLHSRFPCFEFGFGAHLLTGSCLVNLGHPQREGWPAPVTTCSGCYRKTVLQNCIFGACAQNRVTGNWKGARPVEGTSYSSSSGPHPATPGWGGCLSLKRGGGCPTLTRGWGRHSTRGVGVGPVTPAGWSVGAARLGGSPELGAWVWEWGLLAPGTGVEPVQHYCRGGGQWCTWYISPPVEQQWKTPSSFDLA